MSQVQSCQPGGDNVPKLEPTCPERSRRGKCLKFTVIDPIIQELRGMFKERPEWFEVPRPRSIKGKNEVEYSIKF